MYNYIIQACQNLRFCCTTSLHFTKNRILSSKTAFYFDKMAESAKNITIDETKCKGCHKTFETTLLTHLAKKKSCKITYSEEEYSEMKKLSKVKANLRYKQKNKAKISDQGAAYYAKNREAIREKQAIYQDKNRKAINESKVRRYNQDREKRMAVKRKKMAFDRELKGIYAKVEIVNDDNTKFTADPYKVKEAIRHLELGKRVPVDAMFMEEETDEFLGPLDDQGKPFLDISDIDLNTSACPGKLKTIIQHIQSHIDLGNSCYPASFMRRQIAVHKREIAELVKDKEEYLDQLLEFYENRKSK